MIFSQEPFGSEQKEGLTLIITKLVSKFSPIVIGLEAM